jgi:hypothetical protein
VRASHEIRVVHAAEFRPPPPRAFNHGPRIDKNAVEVKQDGIASQYGAISPHSSGYNAAPTHSDRNATVGSTRCARRVGTAQQSLHVDMECEFLAHPGLGRTACEEEMQSRAGGG